MVAVTLDQVLRSLEPRGEVSFSLADIPIDELLLTLHETRFSGTVELGRPAHADRVIFKGGKILDAFPYRFLHVKLLAEILLEVRAVSSSALRQIIEEDALLDGDLLGRRLLARGLLSPQRLREVNHEQARRRLFYLYDHSGGPALIRQGAPRQAPLDLQPVDLFPAVAYGIVVRAHPRRRQAMLAFAANKRARLVTPYDVARNRWGLPPPLLEGTQILSGEAYHFGALPALPGLNADTTAGLLLLFHRMSLLELGEITARPPPDPPTTPRATEVIPRLFTPPGGTDAGTSSWQ
jgi:hypothetical protein